MRLCSAPLRFQACAAFLVSIFLLLAPARAVAAAGFDEQAWRLLTVSDPLQAVDQMRARIQEHSLTPAERARAHVLLGALLGEQLGDLAGGADHYRKALMLEPSSADSADVRYALALLLISSGQYGEARRELAYLLKQMPNHPQAFSIRATLSDLEGRSDRPQAPRPVSPLPEKKLLPGLGTATPVASPPQTSREPSVRVLVHRAPSLRIASEGSLFLYDASGKLLTRQAPPLHCATAGAGVRCGEHAAAALQIIPARGRHLTLNGKGYRGVLVLHAEAQKLIAVNRLPVERYLYGVLPREVPHDWPIEALKAQAVAARTYAYSQMQRANGLPYDVEATVMSQVYGGLDGEQPATSRAVDETANEILTWNGQSVIAYFHSHSGGRTEDPANVWGASLPYLVSRDDPYSLQGDPMRWQARFHWRDVRARLERAYPHIGRLRGIAVGARAGKRAVKMKLVGTRSSEMISANRLRILLGPAVLKSTAFEMKRNDRQVVFSGTGYGHGVGLSQWGAYAMASAGKGYREILSFYYHGVTIQPGSR